MQFSILQIIDPEMILLMTSIAINFSIMIIDVKCKKKKQKSVDFSISTHHPKPLVFVIQPATRRG